MQFCRFYALVFREAFRHSLDLTQTIVFIIIFFAGLIAYGNPGAKVQLEALDLNGWQVAAIVFGCIIALRLIMAPYWVYKTLQGRVVAQPSGAVDYQLRVRDLRYTYNRAKKAIQLGLWLGNSFAAPIRFEMEEMDVRIEGQGNDNPGFKNKTAIAPALSPAYFDYDWIILDKWIKPGSKGTIGITYKYGIAGQSLARKARYVAEVVFEKNNRARLLPPLEDTEEPI